MAGFNIFGKKESDKQKEFDELKHLVNNSLSMQKSLEDRVDKKISEISKPTEITGALNSHAQYIQNLHERVCALEENNPKKKPEKPEGELTYEDAFKQLAGFIIDLDKKLGKDSPSKKAK
jgi:hypothetical protein